MDNTIFTPVRGYERDILAMDYQDGFLYFAIDTKKIYLDSKGQSKIPMGGGGSGSAGSGVIFGDKAISLEEESMATISFALNQLNIDFLPNVDAIILNTADGCFYRVIAVNSESDIQATRLTVAGSGGGGGGGSASAKIDIQIISGASTGATYVYKQPSNLVFRGSVDNGDPTMKYLVKVSGTEAGQAIEKQYGPFTANVGEDYIFELGTKLYLGSNNIQIVATSDNAGWNKTHNITMLNCVEMELKASENFNPLVIFDKAFQFYCVIKGRDLNKTVDIYIDNVLQPALRQANITVAEQECAFTIPPLVHGTHNIKAVLTCKESAASTELSYNISCVTPGENAPVIWYSSNTPTSIVDHDRLTIEHMIYNPASTQGVETHYYINGAEIPTSPMEINYSSGSWLKWNVVGYKVGVNTFTIVVGNTTSSITINVAKDTTRNLDIVQTGLFVNLTAAGRSNNENVQSRQTWQSVSSDSTTTTQVKFNNFNWYNNGWKNDDNGDTCLRISNGASIEIPLNVMTQKKLTNSLAFELVFKIRNVQNYSTLINTVVLDEDSDNSTVIKSVSSTDGVWGSYYNAGIGFCLGTQEAFFKSKNSLVSGRYKEDDIVHLTFVVEAEGANSNRNKLIYIYINGINSGIVKYNLDTDSLLSNCKALKINSDYCDIDLYKLRVYKINLTAQDVIQNYLADKNNADLYDMNNDIVDYKNGIPSINYLKMLEYNRTHADSPLMPYMVVETVSADDVLPYNKATGDAWSVNIDFVNPTLDYEYENNVWTSDDWTNRGYKSKDEMYYCSAPSYRAEGVDFNVQGTSSQGYPIRNYKAKFKKSKSWVYTAPWAVDSSNKQISLLKGGVTKSNYKVGKKFHMDSVIGENKTTLKADYMDSSGTHNTGFASFVGTLYDSHPLDKYIIGRKGTTNIMFNDKEQGFDTQSLRTTVYGFPILMFQKKHDGTYRFLGRYNYNLDKGCDDTLGFCDWGDDHYVDVTALVNASNFDNKKLYVLRDGEYQELAESDVYDNSINYYRLDEAGDSNALNPDYDPTNPYSRQYLPWSAAAECWEFRNNQPGRCRFKHANFAETDPETGIVTVIKDVEYRYHVDADSLDNAYDGVGSALKSDGEVFATAEALNSFVVKKMSRLEKLYDWLISTDVTAPTDELLPEPVVYSDIQYTHDTKEYRKAKFVHEFDQHLDKEYCLVYYIMTELLLCYDSRGKNLMMATWGPKEKGGNDIWFPIFYDIDTQLGVNNSGVPYWDYYENATEDNIFSVPNSVLWVNLWECFKEEVKSKYRTLTSGDKLTIQSLNGYYNFDAQVSKSRAMAGNRPIILHNVDEYLKYIAPSITGFTDTTGATGIISDAYYYCLQGTRELQRELFLRNRFNYISSQWQGGAYSVTSSTQGLHTRFNGNDKTMTSDKYLENPTQEQLDSGYEQAPYPQPLDTRPEFYITPFLKQYVGYYYDQTPSAVVYAEGGQTVQAPYPPVADYAEKFKSEILTQQIFNFGGAEFISSLGDLSTKYLNEIFLKTAKRLKDLIIGSDIPGYRNKGLTGNSFQIENSATAVEALDDGTNRVIANKNAKTLLEKIVLTGLTGLDGTFDVSGSEKLKELRALGTNINSFILADGVQIQKLHLPETVTNISLKESTSLTNLLSDTTPAQSEVISYQPVHVIESEYVDNYENYYVNTIDGYKNCRDLDYFGYSYLEVEEMSREIFNTYSELFVYDKINNIYNLATEYIDGETYYTQFAGLPYAHSRNYYEKVVTEVNIYPDGLFINGLTNLSEILPQSKTKLSAIEIIGGNMGYSSYDLLSKTTTIKQQMIANRVAGSDDDPTLAIKLENVAWTPYRLVSYGETPEDGAVYKLRNDHDEFVDYTKTSGEYLQWSKNTLNGLVYQYNPEAASTSAKITSLDILDTYINDYVEAKELYDALENKDLFDAENYNFFKSTDSYAQGPTLAHLTGTIFVNNDAANPIEESRIKNYYHDTYYPKLDIQVAHITKGNVAKFVEIVDGKEIVWDTLKYPADGQAYPNISEKRGSKLNYDFLGWSTQYKTQEELDAMSEEELNALIVTPEEAQNLLFADADDRVIKFYAVYTIHSYTFNFLYANNSLIESIEVPAGQYVPIPQLVPYKDDSELPFNQTWNFLGYARTPDAADTEVLSLLDEDNTKLNLISNSDLTLYATFAHDPISVYDNVHYEYFRFEQRSDYGGGYEAILQVKPRGKVTVPATYNNQPVIYIGPSFAVLTETEAAELGAGVQGMGENITHVFFEKNNSGTSNIRVFKRRSFYNTWKLQFVEFPEGLEVIDAGAFTLVPITGSNRPPIVFNTPQLNISTLKTIGEAAFQNRLGTLVTDLFIGYNVESIGRNCFGPMSASIDDNLGSITIGDEQHKSNLVLGNVVIVNNRSKYRLNFYTNRYSNADMTQIETCFPNNIGVSFYE